MRRYKLIGLLLVIPLLALAGISIYWSPKPVVNIYDRVPTTENSNKYRVEVNGASVPVELYPTTTGNVGFARFALVDPAKITVSVREPITHYVLSPKAYNIAVSVSGNKMSFTLDNPQYLVLHQLNGLREELFLLADAPETNPPQLGTPGVTNALDQKGIDNQNRADSAAGLTAALASISKAGGGTLYVPPGVYKIQHSILLPSNVNLYLAPGSVLQVDPKYPCCFHDQGVIDIEDANDVKLTGRGIINGNVVNIPPGKQDFHLIVTENVQRLQIDGVTLLDQGDAALRLVDVHNGMVQNVKMLASRPHAGADGIDFDSSDNILVDNAFIYSSDDSTSQGAGTGLRHTIKDNFNLTVQNSVLYQAQTGAAFKIGTTDPQKKAFTILSTTTSTSSAACRWQPSTPLLAPTSKTCCCRMSELSLLRTARWNSMRSFHLGVQTGTERSGSSMASISPTSWWMQLGPVIRIFSAIPQIKTSTM